MKYIYSKYNSIIKNTYKLVQTESARYTDPGNYLYTDYSFDKNTGKLTSKFIKVTGYHQGGFDIGSTYLLSYWWWYKVEKWLRDRYDAVVDTPTYSKGALVSTIVAEEGTYPDDGYNPSDKFWYVKGASSVGIDVTVTPIHLYNKPATITMQTDPVTNVQYKVNIGTTTKYDYGSITSADGYAEIKLECSDLNVGDNTITIYAKDSSNEYSTTFVMTKEDKFRSKVDRTFKTIEDGYKRENILFDSNKSNIKTSYTGRNKRKLNKGFRILELDKYITKIMH